MNGEILSLETAKELTENEKIIERLTRDRNLYVMENARLTKLNDTKDQRISYLEKRDNTLTALEKSLPQRIETYKKKNAPEVIIKELQLLSDMLSLEKEKLMEKEVEENEEKWTI